MHNLIHQSSIFLFYFLYTLTDIRKFKIVIVIGYNMDEKLIKDYIAQFLGNPLPDLIPRELKIKTAKNRTIVIIGPRRAGKTYYFFQLIKNIGKNQAIYLDFEEFFLRELELRDIFKIILELFPEVSGNDVKYIFLDEIQVIENWENLVRSLLSRGFNVFITGSSSKLSGKEIATQLRGRTLTYILLPFSFREFVKAKNAKLDLNILSNIGKLKNLFSEYIEYGGFPEVVLSDSRHKLLRDYLDLIFLKDFVERHNIRNFTLARFLFSHVIQNFSKELSVRALWRKLKSSGRSPNLSTIYDYVEHLEDTLFLFFLRRFSLKASIRESWPRKVYLADMGLTKAMRFFEDVGKLLENAVFLELLRQTNIHPLYEIYYWREKKHEVDFVIKEGEHVKQLIQVTYANSFDEIEKREIQGVLKASDLLGCNNLLILTWDYDDKRLIENKEIKFIPAWKWMLEQK